MSHPTRVRGLKYARLSLLQSFRTVAPYTGAWIEILAFGVIVLMVLSHPTRVRGLK